jgi:hypothetical protein
MDITIRKQIPLDKACLTKIGRTPIDNIEREVRREWSAIPYEKPRRRF